MVMKHHPPEFKADAVALYRSRPGVTIAHIADELGINRETLRNWIRADDDQRSTHTTTPAKTTRPAPARLPLPRAWKKKTSAYAPRSPS